MEAVYDLSGRTAVVTGGAGDIGRAIVARLATAGASVWVWELAADDGSEERVVLVPRVVTGTAVVVFGKDFLNCHVKIREHGSHAPHLTLDAARKPRACHAELRYWRRTFRNS